MEIEATEIADVKILKPAKFGDERGFFSEVWNARTLKEAGLNAITGGGAEIFDQAVRDQICNGKETAEEWADVHRTWHKMGMRSTATML